MTSPQLAYSKKGVGRHYRHPQRDDVDYPSITSIIDVKHKPLTGWAARETAGAAFDNRHALAALEDRDAAIDMLKGAPFKKRDAKADLGDTIHEVAEALAGDTKLPDYSNEVAPYVEGFLAWVSEFGVEFIYTEFTVFNHAYAYAGTGDALVDIGGKRIAVDYKSGKGVYEDTALQLSALAHGQELVLPSGEVIAMPSVAEAAALHLTPEGAKYLPVRDLPDAFDGFLGARELWEWATHHGARAIGNPVDAQTVIDPFVGVEGTAG